MASTRARTPSIFLKSASWTRSSSNTFTAPFAAFIRATMPRLRIMSVQPSWTISSSAQPPETKVLKFSIRFLCHPGFNALAHSWSVGRSPRTSIDDGVLLEDVELLGRRCEVRHHLDRRCAGTDDADPLVRQPIHAAFRIATGIAVIPTARMEAMAGKTLDARNAREFRAVEGAVRHDDEPGPQRIPTVGCYGPSTRILVPRQVGHLGLEKRPPVEVVAFRDPARVGTYLGPDGILARRHEPRLFEQRQIDVAFNVAGGAWVPVPIPRTPRPRRLSR